MINIYVYIKIYAIKSIITQLRIPCEITHNGYNKVVTLTLLRNIEDHHHLFSDPLFSQDTSLTFKYTEESQNGVIRKIISVINNHHGFSSLFSKQGRLCYGEYQKVYKRMKIYYNEQKLLAHIEGENFSEKFFFWNLRHKFKTGKDYL